MRGSAASARRWGAAVGALCVMALSLGLAGCGGGGAQVAQKPWQPPKPTPIPAPPPMPDRELIVELPAPESLKVGRIELLMHGVLTGKDEVLTLDPKAAHLKGGLRNVDYRLELAEGEFAGLYADIYALGAEVVEYPDRADKHIDSYVTIEGAGPVGEAVTRRFKVDYRGTSGKMYYRLKSYRDRIMREVLSVR